MALRGFLAAVKGDRQQSEGWRGHDTALKNTRRVPVGRRIGKRKRNLSETRSCVKKNGGAEGNRTPDLLNAIQALSQLSYSPSRAIKLSHSSACVKGTAGAGVLQAVLTSG